MVAAARKYKRTVQVGLQRRSTPHLLEARERYIDSGKLGKIAYVDIHSYYGGPGDFPPNQQPPETLDWDMYVGPATWRDYNPGIHPRSWRACREFSNGQTGDLCVHLFDVVRLFLGLGWPKSISASGGILMRSPDSNINLHDTQTALFDYGDVQVVWNQRNWGENPEPDYPWGATLYGDKGTLKFSVWSYDFIPKGDGDEGASRLSRRTREVSRGLDAQGDGDLCRTRHAAAHAELPRRAAQARVARGGHRARPHFLRLLHHGELVDGTGPQPAVGCDRGESRGRRRGQSPARPHLPRRLGPSHTRYGVDTVHNLPSRRR